MRILSIFPVLLLIVSYHTLNATVGEKESKGKERAPDSVPGTDDIQPLGSRSSAINLENVPRPTPGRQISFTEPWQNKKSSKSTEKLTPAHLVSHDDVGEDDEDKKLFEGTFAKSGRRRTDQSGSDFEPRSPSATDAEPGRTGPIRRLSQMIGESLRSPTKLSETSSSLHSNPASRRTSTSTTKPGSIKRHTGLATFKFHKYFGSEDNFLNRHDNIMTTLHLRKLRQRIMLKSIDKLTQRQSYIISLTALNTVFETISNKVSENTELIGDDQCKAIQADYVKGIEERKHKTPKEQQIIKQLSTFTELLREHNKLVTDVQEQLNNLNGIEGYENLNRRLLEMNEDDKTGKYTLFFENNINYRYNAISKKYDTEFGVIAKKIGDLLPRQLTIKENFKRISSLIIKLADDRDPITDERRPVVIDMIAQMVDKLVTDLDHKHSTEKDKNPNFKPLLEETKAKATAMKIEMEKMVKDINDDVIPKLDGSKSLLQRSMSGLRPKKAAEPAVAESSVAGQQTQPKAKQGSKPSAGGKKSETGGPST